MLILAFFIGIATAVAISIIHLLEGASRLNFLGTEFRNYYFLHGKLEFLGATIFPAFTYLALTLWLPGMALANQLRRRFGLRIFRRPKSKT